MLEVINYFDNREKAILFWLFLLLIFLIWKKAFSKNSFINLLKAFTQKSIITSLLFLFIYVTTIIYLFYKLSIWEFSYFSTTIVWFIGIFFIFFLNIGEVRDFNFFKKAIKDNFRFFVFIEFLINLYVLNFFLELLLIPIIVFISATLGFSSTNPKYKSVEKLLTQVQGIIGLLLLGFTLFSIFSNINNFFTIYNLKEFLIPIIFTILIIPFFYSLSLLIIYSDIFKVLNKSISDHKLNRYSKFKTIKFFNIKLQYLHSWYRYLLINKLSNKFEISSAIKKIK